MNDITVTFKDGTTKSYQKGITYDKVAKDYPGKYPYVGVKINNVIFSLDDKIEEDVEVDFIDFMDPSGSKMYKCGVEFILEVALKSTFENSEVHFLHSHPKGVYAEIKSDKVFTEEDFLKLKSKMSEIVSSDKQIRKYNVNKKDAIKYNKEHGCEEKAENINNFAEEIVTFYVLDNYANYFYSEMPNRTSIMNLYDIKYLGSNKIVILLPTKMTQGRVPEYVGYDGIIKSFENTQSWRIEILTEDRKYYCYRVALNGRDISKLTGLGLWLIVKDGVPCEGDIPK